jgi:tRNA (guanine-N7-)-methyltransferase
LSSDPSITIATETEIVPANRFAPLQLETIFGRSAPLEVDLGCGDGSFLAAIAAENPAANFLGIERLRGRVRSACRKIELRGLRNARILQAEIGYVVEQLLPPNSVNGFHIMFPDPWPKRRHALRRLLTEAFLESLHRPLVAHGTVQIATDHRDYFHQITRAVSHLAGFAVLADTVPTSAVSKFETRFQQDGVEIHRLGLRKASEVT